MAIRSGISIREFARREKVSDTLVHQALKNGRLKAFPDRSLDPALVGTPWRHANAKAVDDLPPTSAKGLPYSEAIRLKENYLAMLRRLEYEEKSGALIELAVAEAVVFDAFRSYRDALLNWPTRVGPLLAADLNIDVELVVSALTSHVHALVSEFGEPNVEFDNAKG
jgi:hypothetical protein